MPYIVDGTYGLISSPEAGTAGIGVADASGVTRVQVGMIGTYTAQTYGIKVVSSDGSTVIIDGTSNMFKIATSGTGSKTSGVGPIGRIGSLAVTLSGLGQYLVSLPALLTYEGDVNDTISDHWLAASGPGGILGWAANASGGATTTAFMHLNGTHHQLSWHANSVSNFLEIWDWIATTVGGTSTVWYKCYVLIETAM